MKSIKSHKFEKRINSIRHLENNQAMLLFSDEICLVCLDTGEIIKTMENSGDFFNVLSPDGKLILSCDSNDSMVTLSNALTGEKIYSVKHQMDGFLRIVNFSHDGKRFLSANEDGGVCVWNTKTGKLIVSTLISGYVHDAMFVNSEYARNNWMNQNSIITCGCVYDNSGCVYDNSGGVSSYRLWMHNSFFKNLDMRFNSPSTNEKSNSYDTIAMSPNGVLIAATSSRNVVRLYDVNKSKPMETIIGENPENTVIKVCASFSPDSKFLVTGGWDNTVNLYQI